MKSGVTMRSSRTRLCRAAYLERYMNKRRLYMIGLLLSITCLLSACGINADSILNREQTLTLELHTEKGLIHCSNGVSP
jgi:hypothetical protein